MRNSLRTQIILPKELRREIDKNRNGENLSEYIRIAAKERLERERKKKTNLKKLADDVIGSIKPGSGGWGDINVNKWIRKTRQEEDKHWLKRLNK